MKAVIFAGGFGTRMRENTEFIPKPMVEIGGKPVLWHLMKIFSNQGVNDFVVLAGYRASAIQDYFVNFRNRVEAMTISTKSGKVEHHSESEDWTVTVLDTGLHTSTGDRLKMAEKYLRGEDFFCTYGDGLANVDLSRITSLSRLHPDSSVVTVTHPKSRFGVVTQDAMGRVTSFDEKQTNESLINIGFFLFRPDVFDLLGDGKMLEEGALPRLTNLGRLRANIHEGFWRPMDTQREHSELSELFEIGSSPWLPAPAHGKKG